MGVRCGVHIFVSVLCVRRKVSVLMAKSLSTAMSLWNFSAASQLLFNTHVTARSPFSMIICRGKLATGQVGTGNFVLECSYDLAASMRSRDKAVPKVRKSAQTHQCNIAYTMRATKFCSDMPVVRLQMRVSRPLCDEDM